jgi:hypothetical protein
LTDKLQVPEDFTLTTRPLTLQLSPVDFLIFIAVPFGAFGKVNFVAKPLRFGILLVFAKYRVITASLVLVSGNGALTTGAAGVAASGDSLGAGVGVLTDTSTGLLLTAQTLPPPDPL